MTRATKRETADQVTLKISTRRYGLKLIYFFGLESPGEEISLSQGQSSISVLDVKDALW